MKWRSRRNSVGPRCTGLPRARHAMRHQVHDDVGIAQRLVGQRRPDAAQHGADAGHELGRRERLGDIVVGAGIEAAHAIALLAARRQHDDRQVGGRRSGGAAGGTPRCPTSGAASSRAGSGRARPPAPRPAPPRRHRRRRRGSPTVRGCSAAAPPTRFRPRRSARAASSTMSDASRRRRSMRGHAHDAVPSRHRARRCPWAGLRRSRGRWCGSSPARRCW